MEKWQEEMAAIRAAMAENMKGFAEIRELQKRNEEEARERATEERKRAAEAMERADKERAEAMERAAAADKRLAKLDESLDKLKETVVGIKETVVGITDNHGFEAEEFFQSVFAQNLNFAGIKFDKMYPNWKIVGKENCEFDIVLVNGESAAIIEVKNRIHPSFVKRLATTKLAQFKKYFQEIKEPKIYLAVAGFSFANAVIEEADKYGIGVIRQKGDSYVVNTDSIKTY